MAYRRRRKSRGTRGLRCLRRKRVRVRGGRMALRCAKYSSRHSGGGRRRRRGGYRRSHRKPAGMARRGSRCTLYRRVRVRGQGYARRCAHYSRRRR